MRLFVIDYIITNNTGTYLTFNERILCLFIIKIIAMLDFDRHGYGSTGTSECSCNVVMSDSQVGHTNGFLYLCAADNRGISCVISCTVLLTCSFKK